MTGLAWGAQFSISDPTTLDSTGTRPGRNPQNGRRLVNFVDVLIHIDNLAIQGANVINISLGASGTALLNLQDTVAMRSVREQIGAFRGGLLAAGRVAPLLVVSSGNVSLADPRVSLFPMLKDSLPNHVLVVAALKRDSTLLTAPQNSSYIDLVAPGESIGYIDDSGVFLASGASFATPIVTGVAALIRSFDPRIPSDSVRQLILDGALRSSRRVGGYLVADAFESMKLAAARPGAPLCGNRIWADGRDVFAQRTTGPENIATLPSSWTHPNRLLPFHGGRLLLAALGGDVAGFDWTPTGFVTTTRFPQSLETFRGTTTALQATHDGDSSAFEFIDDSNNMRIFATALSGGWPSGTALQVGNPIAVTGPVLQAEARCARFDFNAPTQAYVCAESVMVALSSERLTARTLPSPSFQRIAVAVTRLRKTLINEVAQDCRNATATPPSRCPKFVYSETPLSTRTLLLRRDDGTVLADWTVAGTSVRLNTFTEDDTELAVEEKASVRLTYIERIGIVGGNGWQTQVADSGETVTQCAMVYYDLPATLAPQATRMPMNTNVCVWSLGTSTFGREAGPVALGPPLRETTPKGTAPVARHRVRAPRR